MPKPWIKHVGRTMPVSPDTIIEAMMANDGYVIGPMAAKEFDWDFPGDPVEKYREVTKQ